VSILSWRLYPLHAFMLGMSRRKVFVDIVSDIV